jgi:hypothetical protein
MQETRPSSLTGGEDLFRLKSGELIELTWIIGTARDWHNDQRSTEPGWYTHSVSPRRVLAFRVRC